MILRIEKKAPPKCDGRQPLKTMHLLLSFLIILTFCSIYPAQDRPSDKGILAVNPTEVKNIYAEKNSEDIKPKLPLETAKTDEDKPVEDKPIRFPVYNLLRDTEQERFGPSSNGNFKELYPTKTKTPDDDKKTSSSQDKTKDKFHWKPALIQSGIFLGMQHGTRLLQKKTTRELVGPFFRDWFNSVKGLRGWDDGDNLLTNYVAHPMQGSLTGRIFVNNSDRAKRQEFGSSKEYWKSRFKAALWSTAWSIQFELGPISEASLGNVGLKPAANGRSYMTYQDLVITPTVGTAVLILEDAIDKYVLKNWLEKKKGYRVTTKIKILRCALTPTTCFANILRGKVPWKRDFR